MGQADPVHKPKPPRISPLAGNLLLFGYSPSAGVSKIFVAIFAAGSAQLGGLGRIPQIISAGLSESW
jgi:hypothetical protein